MNGSGLEPREDLRNVAPRHQNEEAQSRRFETSAVSDHVHSHAEIRLSPAELPMTVRDAARFLGVSRQLLYSWVERKQIPHLRVMGRNIRFLKSDLEPFRAQFKQEVENGTAK